MHPRVSFETDPRIRELIKAEQRRLAKTAPGIVPTASAAIRAMILRAATMVERPAEQGPGLFGSHHQR